MSTREVRPVRTSKGGRVLLVCRRCVEEIHLEGGERDIPQKWSFSYIYFPQHSGRNGQIHSDSVRLSAGRRLHIDFLQKEGLIRGIQAALVPTADTALASRSTKPMDVVRTSPAFASWSCEYCLHTVPDGKYI